ncbi:MAG: hypothetical protein E7351_00235 [Clostridiales bacterium]|nr:hypothetical protein [Clostridiales bacterium]
MNINKIDETIKLYKNYLRHNNQSKNDFNDRKARIAYYQKFNKESFLKITEEDFIEFIGKLWASSMYGSKKYLVDQMILSNKGFDNLKLILADFIYGKQDLSSRWDKFLKEAKFFGPSYMSEILGYIYPNDYALANNQVIKALDYLEMPKVPHYNYQFTGKKYLEICDTVKHLAKRLGDAGVDCENLLAVDYYLWEVTRLTADKSLNEIKTAEKPITNKEQEFIHKEIIDKIVEIGGLLGFEAKSEVKVGKGAIVDAVWSINIGNMGQIMYVFEVQTKGSIDSLLLNLQKANNNKSVQSIVAVSDEVQLQKIKNESEEIDTLKDLKLWDYKDVLNVYDSLNNAMTSINKLGLVPKSF